MSPGKRDTITFEAGGCEELCQKRHLYVITDKYFNLFKEEYPDDSVRITKFAELGYALLSKDMPKKVRLCKIQENFITLIETIHKGDPTVPFYSHDFVSDLLFNPSNKPSWNNACVNCQDGKLFKFNLGSLENEFTWFQWQKKVSVAGTEQLQKLEIHGSKK